MQVYAAEQLKGGITTVQYMGTGFTASETKYILKEAGLPQRIRMIAWPRSNGDGRQLAIGVKTILR